MFDNTLIDALRGAYSALNLSRDWPRLEAVLDIAAAEHGLEVLAALLADLEDAPPNGDHVLFAEHTRRGGEHVTANFDTCIERAGGDPARVVHFHGALGDRGDVSELGARVSGIERGFRVDMRRRLDEMLGAASLLVVVGYSGFDYFDVDPYWRDAARRGVFRDVRVVWVNHAQDWGLLAGHSCGRKQLRLMADE